MNYAKYLIDKPDFALFPTLKKLEHALIYEALLRTKGNQLNAAKLLKIAPSTLCEKIKYFGIVTEHICQKFDEQMLDNFIKIITFKPKPKE